MGQTVKLRRSAVGGKKPLNSQLELGELSVNTTDGKLYFAKSGSQGPSVEEIITTNAKNTGSLDIVGSITASNFTGSFTGDGSGLYNISVSGVTGLSLDKLTYGSSTASIDDRGLQVNVDTAITGSLTATEFTGSGLGLTNVPFRLSGSSAELTAYDDQYTKIHFDDSTGIKIEGDSSTGIARIYLDGVAAAGGGNGSTALLSVTGATSTWTFTHNLGEKYPAITVFDSNNNVIIPQNIEAVSDTQLVVSFASPQTGYVTATVGGGLPSISSSYGGRFLTVNSDGTAPEWSEVDFVTNGSFNTYTSSIGLRVDSLETESGSIRDDFNTITSSFGDRLRLLEGESGSIRVDFNSYTSSNNTLNVTQNGRLNSLETESGSIRTFFNAYTASNNTTNTVQNNRLSALETKSGSLDSDISTIEGRLDSIETESGSIRGTFNSYTSSNNTKNSEQDGRLDSIESFTASIDDTYATDEDVNRLRGDFNTYTSSNNNTNSTQNGRLNSLETESGSIRGAFNTYTSSNNTINTTQNSRLSSLETKTGSLDSDISTIEGRLDSIETTTSSLDGRVDSLETESASIRTTFNSYTSSNNTTNTTQNNRLTSLETTTASFDGRLDSLETTSASHDGRLDTIEGGLEFTGSNVTVKGNLLVKGTETRVNSTTVEISDNIISLNGSGAANGGIEVRDTTSPGLLSGSLLWDSTNNYWIGGTKGSEERLLDRRDLTSLSGDISTLDGRVDSLETESGSIRTAFNTYTSSNNTTNTTQNNRLTSLETKTGSLDDDISTIDGRLDSIETESGSIRTTFNSYTSSNNTTNTTQNSRLTSLESKTGSYLTSYTETQTLEDVATLGNATTLDLEARSFIVTGANGSQFLKGDGSLDGNTYLTAHPSVSAATSSNNSGRTYIQDILLDSFGHITGITTATETVVNTDTNNFTTGATFNTSDGVVTFTRNNGNTYTVDLDGRYLQSYTETDPIFTASDAFNIRTADITNWNTAFGWGDHSTIGYLTAHPSVSAATSSNNSGRTYIQDILLDSFGHITGITTASETVVDTYITGATFNTTSGVITFTKNNGGTVTVDIDGKYAESGHNHDADYVNVNGDTMTGNLKVRGNINIEDGDLIMDSGTVNGTNYRKIRFTEDIDSAAGFQGAYMHYNADDNLFQIGTHEASDTNILNDVYHISMTRGTGDVTINNNITASSFIKRNGTSSQFLMADGSVSTNPGWLTAHPSVSAATSSNNSGRTYIQDILLDGFGHITGITTATETVVDTNNFTTGVTWNAGTATLRFTKNDGDSYDVQMLETLTDVTVTGGTYNSGTQTLRLTKSDGSTVDVSGFAIDTDVNWYITGLTFNTGTGVLTATRNDGGTTTVDLDGRYLQSYTETDTLDSVAKRGNTTDQTLTMGGLVISGASATATSLIFSENGTNILGFRYGGNLSGNPLDIYNFQSNTLLMRMLEGGATTFTNSVTSTSFIKSGGTSTQFLKADGSVDGNTYLTAHPSVSAASSSNNSGRTYIQDILLDGFGHITGITTATETVVDTNNYVTGATFNTGNGIITLTKNDGTTVTVDIDGRFLTSYTETDTLASVTARGASTTTNITTGLQTIYKQTDTTGTDGTTFITLDNNVGGDISQQQTFIDFKFTDTNANFTPQVRIGAQVGPDADANAISREGAGSFVVYTAPIGNDESGGSTGLVEQFRVSYNGTVTAQGQIVATGGNSTQWNTAYGWGNHASAGYLTSYTDTNNYVTGATFNTGDGIVTLTRNDGNTVTVDLDGRYLQSYTETDTLATVVSRGSTTTSQIGVGSIDIADGGYSIWVNSYAVSNTNIEPLTNSNGELIQTGGAYRVTAHIDGTGTDQSSKAVIWNQNGTWYVNETSRSGSSSNHIQFLISGGLPSVKTWHQNNYTVRVLFERINLYENDGTDNTRDYWGTDSYMSNIQDNVTFVLSSSGSVTAPKFVKSGGTSSQFLMADGSVSTNPGWLTAHPSVSAATSSDNSGRTYIQDILLDSFGHITGITTATETVVNTDTNNYVTGATFNTGNGIITLTRNDGNTVTVDIDGRFLTSYTETDPIYVSERDSLQLNKTVQPTLLFSTLADFDKPSGYSTMIQPSSYRNPLPSHGFYHIIGRRDTQNGYGAFLQSYNSHELYHGNTTVNTTDISWYKIWNSGDFTATNVSNWDTAYGWGNHASAGYTTTDYYTTGATFNSGTGIVTFTRNDGNTYTLNIASTLTDVTVTGGTYNSGTQTLRLTKSDGNTVDVSGFAIDTDVNWYTTGATFNTGNGIITGTHQGGTWTVDIDGRYLELGGGTLTGDLIVGSTSTASNRVVRALSNDDHRSGFEAYGNSQGNGYLYVGQSSTYGGGISYNGDGSPAFIGGETADYITFYRREAGVDTEVFAFPYSNNNVYFNGEVHAGGGNSSQWNTAVAWGDHAGLYLGINSKAADSNLLDGYNYDNFIGKNGNTYFQLTTWLQSTGTHGFYSPSSGAGTHFYPGVTSYGSFRIEGGANSFLGIELYTLTKKPTWMWDNNGGGMYSQTDSVWYHYYSHSTGRLHIRSSSENAVWHSGDFTSTNISNWNTAYGWGNHASVGYTNNAFASEMDQSVITTASPAFRNIYLQGTANPTLYFNGSSDTGIDMAIQASPEGLDFFEPEDGGKIHFRIYDDTGVDATFGYWVNGTQIITSGRLLQNVTNTNWDTAYSWGNHAGLYMTQGQTRTDINTINNGGNRYDPSTNNPTNEHYAVLTYGNNGNVTGQLATHFVTGNLYSRGYNSSWSTWRRYWNDTDFTSTNISNWNTAYGWGNHSGLYLGITAKAADSNLLDGLDLHTGRNNEANKVVRTDSNGYLNVGWINTTSGDRGTTAPTRIYASNDEYIRYYTPANFISVLGLITTSSIGSQSVSYASSAGYASEAKWINFDDGPRDLSDRRPNWNNRSVAWDFVTAGTVGGSGNYAGVMTFSPWDGTTASTGDSSYQLAFANITGVNASGIPGLRLRNGIDATWNSWYTIWHSGNDGSGSGLDSDLLDGQEGSYYTNAGNLTGTIGDVFASTTRYNIGLIDGNGSQNRDKIRVWDSSEYTIGMKNGYTYGWLGKGTDGYAMSFQMSNTTGRGFWWGDSGHNDAQGAMSLTTDGKATIATSLTIGEGESITSPSSTTLYVKSNSEGSTVFDVQGTQGQLFSITDDLTGDIFKVSDISGIPILNVNASGVVTIDETLNVYGDVTAYYSSDERLKDNITPISNAIDKVKLIGGYEFDWNELSKHEGHDVGVIAQEIEKVLPELVTTRSNGYKAVKYEKLTALLIQANKELINKVEELEKKLK